MNLRPLNDNVIIKQDPMDYVDDNPEIARILEEGKILIPEKNTVIKSSMTGNIVSWGSRCHYKWKTGQKIVFGRFGGSSILVEGKKYRVLKEWELIGIYEPKLK